MPSPFPGMDPYLEDPGLWPGMHAKLISETQTLLNVGLRPKYVAKIEERVYVADENDPGQALPRRQFIPDLRIIEHGPRSRSSASPAGTAVLENVAEPVEATTMFDEEVRETWLAILDSERRRVVTIIEFLSPANKTPGAAGLAKYLEKRSEVLNSDTHFVEIDLLRGPRPFGPGQQLPPHDYLVHVSRADKRPRGTLWPIRLQQRLPVIPIPLNVGDPDARLDLQAVLDVAYDRAGYDLTVDYAGDPVPPLTGALAEWAKPILERASKRSPN